MEEVRIIDDPLYQLLRNEQVEEFNQKKKEGSNVPSMRLCDFRGLDLRGLDAEGLDLRDAYFRGADLRGINFQKAQLAGASIANAKISGCLFPNELPANEIRLSHDLGTRMRFYRHG